MANTAFWAALGSIILANILLSGDNAVVIAMAARSLPEKQQKKAILFGSGAAIVLRIILTVVASALLKLPLLKIAGGLALMYIGVDLLASDGDEVAEEGNSTMGMGAAIRTILVADLVMSLDNVLAVAAAAKGDNLLLMIGLAVSIPLIIFGSTMLLKVMEKFPVIILLGAALLGFLAGEMILSDPSFKQWFAYDMPHIFSTIAGVCGAAFVVFLGKWKTRRLLDLPEIK